MLLVSVKSLLILWGFQINQLHSRYFIRWNNNRPFLSAGYPFVEFSLYDIGNSCNAFSSLETKVPSQKLRIIATRLNFNRSQLKVISQIHVYYRHLRLFDKCWRISSLLFFFFGFSFFSLPESRTLSSLVAFHSCMGSKRQITFIQLLSSCLPKLMATI